MGFTPLLPPLPRRTPALRTFPPPKVSTPTPGSVPEPSQKLAQPEPSPLCRPEASIPQYRLFLSPAMSRAPRTERHLLGLVARFAPWTPSPAKLRGVARAWPSPISKSWPPDARASSSPSGFRRIAFTACYRVFPRILVRFPQGRPSRCLRRSFGSAHSGSTPSSTRRLLCSDAVRVSGWLPCRFGNCTVPGLSLPSSSRRIGRAQISGLCPEEGRAPLAQIAINL